MTGIFSDFDFKTEIPRYSCIDVSVQITERFLYVAGLIANSQVTITMQLTSVKQMALYL